MGCSSSASSEFCLSTVTTRAIAGWQYQDLDSDSAAVVLKRGPIATACLLRRGCLYVAGSDGLVTLDARPGNNGKRKLRIVDKIANRAASKDAGSAIYFKEYRREDPVVYRLFVAGARGLAMYDLTECDQIWYPTAVGEVLSLKAMVDRGGASMVATSSGDVLYVAGSNGISILDLSKGPERITSIDVADDVGAFRGGRSLQLALVGDRALYVAGGLGLRVFDVSMPRQPKKVGAVIQVAALTTPEHQGGAAMVVARNRLILSGCGGLAFFEISDPLRPCKVGDSIATGAIATYEAGSLVADEEMLAVAGGAGLVVISLLQPGLKLGPIDTGVLCQGCSSCMVLQGDRLYLTGRAVAVLDWALLKCALHGRPPYDHLDPTVSGSVAVRLNDAICQTGSRRARAGDKRGGAAKCVQNDNLATVVRASQAPPPPALLLIDKTASDAKRDEQPVWKHSSLQPAPAIVLID